MYALMNAATRIRPAPITTAVPPGCLPKPPRLCVSERRPAPYGWLTHQRAPYYFDAAWQTTQTLRRLLRANLAAEDLGLRPPPEMLGQAVESLLQSISPGLQDDSESRACFDRLLGAHLSGLSADELETLASLLRAQRFDGTVMESVIDDPMIEEFGFANGPPHRRQRTLMFTSDLYLAIDEARDAASARALRGDTGLRITSGQARQARELLAACAARQSQLGVTLPQFCGIATQMAMAVGLDAAPATAIASSPLHPASTVTWQRDTVLVELSAWSALSLRNDSAVYAVLLRDLLELLLARKLAGSDVPVQALDDSLRSLLFAELERVLSLPPATTGPEMAAEAAAVLARGQTFGTVQVCPTSGVALGHAWIAPTLSAVPDRSQRGREIGLRFMRSGFRLEPEESRSNECEIRWLGAQESEELYPAERAWHLRVPADRLKLQQAAAAVMQDWQRRALPYRFIGTEPGMPATGCRMTVWHAVQLGMDDDARALFSHFRRGLPEPESPTELALRLEQFMHWLQTLAAQNDKPSTDL